MGEALSRILDPSALDACDKPRGRLVIDVPSSFAGAEIEVTIPSRVVCARCDGGGCDGCGKRGGHRIPGPKEERVIRVVLPLSLTGNVLLRVVRPLNRRPLNLDEDGIEQLLIETNLADEASASVTLLALYTKPLYTKPHETTILTKDRPTKSRSALFPAVFLVVVIAISLVFLVLRR